MGDGNLVKANAKNEYSDLFWAIRGGGGSNWGVITSITLKAHKIPNGGFTFANFEWQGTMCEEDKSKLFNFVDNLMSFTLELD